MKQYPKKNHLIIKTLLLKTLLLLLKLLRSLPLIPSKRGVKRKMMEINEIKKIRGPLGTIIRNQIQAGYLKIEEKGEKKMIYKIIEQLKIAEYDHHQAKEKLQRKEDSLHLHTD